VALLRLAGLVYFSKRSHVWVPISLSPLVAFAPAGDREMGTEERSVDPEQRKKRFWNKKEVVLGTSNEAVLEQWKKWLIREQSKEAAD
jgi:hypothetical protein